MKQESLELAQACPPPCCGVSGPNGCTLYVHGQGGSREEAAAFAAAACRHGWQVLSVDLPGHGVRTKEGWGVRPLARVVPELEWVLNARSPLGGYFPLCGEHRSLVQHAGLCRAAAGALPLLSPVLDMPAPIGTMMGWAGVGEEQAGRGGTPHRVWADPVMAEHLR